MTERVLFNKRDMLVLLGILLAAFVIHILFALGVRGVDAAFGQISVNGRVTHTLDLSHDTEFALPENTQVHFAIRGGSVAFIASNCPDKICVNCGFIKLPGQTAVCMPNRVALAIVPADGTENGIIDAFVAVK
jgi:hypothetical protein